MGENFDIKKGFSSIKSKVDNKLSNFKTDELNANTLVGSEFKTTSKGLYKLKMGATLSNKLEIYHTISAFHKGSITVNESKKLKDSVYYTLKVNDSKTKTQVNHGFVEFRHTKNKQHVFIDSEFKFVSGRYNFGKFLVNKNYPAGTYDIYVGAHDKSLNEPLKHKVGSFNNKKGMKKYKEPFAAKLPYNEKENIINIFDEEVDNSNVMLNTVFSIISAVIFLFFISISFKNGANLGGLSSVPVFGFLYVLM